MADEDPRYAVGDAGGHAPYAATHALELFVVCALRRREAERLALLRAEHQRGAELAAESDPASAVALLVLARKAGERAELFRRSRTTLHGVQGGGCDSRVAILSLPYTPNLHPTDVAFTWLAKHLAGSGEPDHDALWPDRVSGRDEWRRLVRENLHAYLAALEQAVEQARSPFLFAAPGWFFARRLAVVAGRTLAHGDTTARFSSPAQRDRSARMSMFPGWMESEIDPGPEEGSA